jgi:aminomethyltransferase
MPVAVAGRSIASGGSKVFSPDGKTLLGYVTSGTMAPYWKTSGKKLATHLGDESAMRNIAMALVDAGLRADQSVVIDIRGRSADARIVRAHLSGGAPPYARPILHEVRAGGWQAARSLPAGEKALSLLKRAVENTAWRQSACLNLIPSEMTLSPSVRHLSVMDPAFRYAEHKQVLALRNAEVFYYQGTDFIEAVERLLDEGLRAYLGCTCVEPRVISGQMANAVVYGALVDVVNRFDHASEPRRLRTVMNHALLHGGHLSAQPMGALHDFVARDPRTGRPAMTHFPVMADNPFRTDVAACREVIAAAKPELIIFGKSMVLHPEPIREIRATLDELGLNAVLMYDMAHVLGLVGPHFQQPFLDGADVVTGSTHKTFFGTQRGIVAMNAKADDANWPLWKAVQRRAFPGAVSNHHLGTLLGLLMAAYEMNHFRDEYQMRVLANAKAFARALKRAGLDVAGDPAVDFTETHQVIVKVGYARGPEIAHRLEESGIIVNFQAIGDEEGFTAAGALRMGVAEMTRFGMKEADFEAAAEMIADVVLRGASAKEAVKSFRGRFLEMQFVFTGKEFDAAIAKLHRLI